MISIARLLLLCGLLTLAACQTRRSRNRNGAVDGQGRTLGLLSPLVSLGLGGLADPYYGAPIRPVSSSSGGSSSSSTQADPAYGGGGYPNYGYQSYGYRPNPYGGYGYGYGYGLPGLGLQLPFYYRPNNYYAGLYQRPVYQPAYQNPSAYQPAYNNYNNNYGNGGGYQRPINSNYGSVLTSPNGIAATSTSSSYNPGLGTSGSTGSTNTAQAAQVAALLGQALGSSLRPLLANGGAGGAAAAGGAAGGGNANALGGLLSLLG